jgi:hypothetical protein
MQLARSTKTKTRKLTAKTDGQNVRQFLKTHSCWKSNNSAQSTDNKLTVHGHSNSQRITENNVLTCFHSEIKAAL